MKHNLGPLVILSSYSIPRMIVDSWILDEQPIKVPLHVITGIIGYQRQHQLRRVIQALLRGKDDA